MKSADIPQIENEDINRVAVGMHGICAHVVMGERTECWGERVPATTFTGPLEGLTRVVNWLIARCVVASPPAPAWEKWGRLETAHSPMSH